MSQTDKVLIDIANYIVDYKIDSALAFKIARYSTIDALGCGLLALQFPECTKLLGPIVPGTMVPNGVRVPGTQFELDPVQGAFNIGAIIRWLDFNDTWLAAEWGHPSDNLGAILSVADYISRQQVSEGKNPLTMRHVLEGLIKAYEIQGVIALENSFNSVGLDHVVLVKVASTAVVTQMLGGTKQDIINAVSNAWVDGQSLRTYRHYPNTGSRKSWAAGDACMRAVRLALFTLKGEMGYPTVLTAPIYGFYAAQFGGKELQFQRNYSSYVMENILFKVSFPAEFHAQTAVECAFKLHSQIKDKLNDIKSVTMETHKAAIRIIDKKGILKNPADRDHCIQYMTAVGLIFGELKAENYENKFAADTRIDILREKMVITEKESYSKDYHDPEKRSIANAIQIEFKDGSKTDRVEVEYPLGHKRRRDESIPFIESKFEENLKTRFPHAKVQAILQVCMNQTNFEKMAVHDFMRLFVI